MKFIFQVLIVLMLSVGAVVATAAGGEHDPLFVNLTSDDAHRANMAITFGGNQFELGHSLTIFLNDKGVLIGSKANADKFADHQKALKELISQGATVIICPMCMKHYAVNKADLLPGVQVGNPEFTGSALFQDNSKALTW